VQGHSGRIARFWRRLTPGRNPVARASDRIEAVLLLLLVVGTLLMVPFAGALGSSTYADQVTLSAQQQAERHAITAVSLTGTPPQIVSGDGAGSNASMVSVTLVDLRGVRHPGDVPAEAGTPAGTRFSIWIDGHGELADAPLSPSATVADGVFTAIMAWAAVTGLLVLVYWIGRRLLDRRRSAGWDRALVTTLR